MLRASTIAVLGAAAALGIVVGGGAYALVGDDRDPMHPTASPPESNATRSTAAAATSQAGQAPESTATPALTLPSSADLRSLAKQVAAKSRGRVQVAVIARRRGHIVVASSSGSASTPFRIWSVSKVATTIALLEAHGWNRRPGRALRADVDAAVRSALVRSSDCAQRQLVVELQEALGGIEPARKAVQQVLRRGGARHARVLDRVSAAGSGCRPLLERTRTPDPYRMALQLGTAEWTITDAARFGLAIGDGTFPASVTRRVTGLLSREKEHSDDPFAHGLDVTSRLDWGAGQAFRGLSPAYKSGWGGSSGETPTFVTEQAIHLRTPSGDYGIAVTFEPPARPARDDPGLTRAPAALYQLLRGVRQLLEL